jgi:tetratricopeptide (TPR) repeat protein
LLSWLVAPILIVVAGLAVWLNHFESTFQDNDFHVIVNNRAIREIANIPQFFTRPLLYADKPEFVEYRPLAEASFAFDYWIVNPVNASVYNVDSFGWFLLGVLVFGLLAGLIPDSNRWAASAAAGLFAFHPLVCETVNYASRRGDIMGLAALGAGLAFWVVWPRHLPKEIMHWEGVPKTEWDDFKRRWSPALNARYRAFVTAPLHLYMIPVIFGLFADPAVAVFPLVMLAWILLFDNGPKRQRPWKRVLPSAVVCGGFWIAQFAVTAKYGAGFRLPAVSYLLVQPWVTVRYIFTFLLPVHLTAGSDLPGFPDAGLAFVLLGFAGLAGLIVLAIGLGRGTEWRAVSFGLWWYLICSLPAIAIPQRPAEANYRMFLALPGLALALSSVGWTLYRRREAAGISGARLNLLAGIVGTAVLLPCCWLTFERNKVWSSQQAFWEDVTEKSPNNGRAFAELASVFIADGQRDRGLAALNRAVKLVSGDGPEEVMLGRAFDLLNADRQAEDHFKKAIAADPGYASAWSAYSQWLVVRQRLDEAHKDADRAIQISPWNTEAWHTILEYYSQTIDWENLIKASQTLLNHDPTDEEGKISLSVGKSAFEEVQQAELRAKQGAGVDDFLRLSVDYYKTRRYADSIKACENALRVHPGLAEAYSNEAAAYYALGNIDEAIRALRETVRLRPDMEVAKQNLAILLQQENGKLQQENGKVNPSESKSPSTP